MNSILITGAAGLTGNALCQALLKRPNLKLYYILNKSRVEDDRVTPLSLSSSEDRKIISQISILFHCATNYGRSGESLEQLIEANVRFPTELIECAKNLNTFINVDTTLPAEISNYAQSKYLFKQYLKQQNSFSIFNLRLEHIYGPGARMHNFVTWLLTQLKDNKVSQIPMSKGLHRRDFVFVDDAISAFVKVMDFHAIERVSQPKYLDIGVGSGQSISIKDLAALACQVCGADFSRLAWGSLPERKNEPAELIADLTELKILGWKPVTSLQEGLAKTSQWIDLKNKK